MARPKAQSAVLTLRVSPTLERRLAREARRRRTTRGQLARRILEAGLSTGEPDLAAEARRQSRLASGRKSDSDALAFVAATADLRHWS